MAAIVAAVAFLRCPASAAEVKDDFRATVEEAPIMLMKDSVLSSVLGKDRHGSLNMWVGEYVEFDDNMFGTSKDKKSDTLFNTVAGFRLNMNEPDVWRLDVAGQLRHKAYAKRDEYNGFEGYFHSTGSLDFSPALTGRFTLNYDNTCDNIRDVQDIYAMHRYSAGLGATLRPSPYMGVDIDGMFFAQRRDVSTLNLQNYNEFTLSVRPYYAVSPHATVFVQFSGSMTRPMEDVYNDSMSFNAGAGLSWAYREDASVTVQVGYKYSYFDDNGTISDTTRHKSDLTASLSGKWTVAQNWTVGAGLSYAPTFGGSSSNAGQSNSIGVLRGNAYVDYTPENNHFNARLGTYASFNDPSNNDRYTEYGGSLGVAYAVNEWLSLTFGYKLGFTKYQHRSPYTHSTVTTGVTAMF